MSPSGTHLYKRVFPSVRPSIRPSVRPSVHLSVSPSIHPSVCLSVTQVQKPCLLAVFGHDPKLNQMIDRHVLRASLTTFVDLSVYLSVCLSIYVTCSVHAVTQSGRIVACFLQISFIVLKYATQRDLGRVSSDDIKHVLAWTQTHEFQLSHEGVSEVSERAHERSERAKRT